MVQTQQKRASRPYTGREIEMKYRFTIGLATLLVCVVALYNTVRAQDSFYKGKQIKIVEV